MDIQFDNHTVVVTGAARGIGGGIVEGFVERGARVWACDVLEELIRHIRAHAGIWFATHADVEHCVNQKG